MKSEKNWYLGTSIILILLFIIPFLYISKYAVFVSDDLCRINSLSLEEYFSTLKFWYLNQNGRFINAIITTIPIGSLFLYRLILSLSFVVLGLALFRFMLGIANFFRINYTKYQLLLLTVIWYIVIIGILPSLYEFFYWYAAVTVYLYGFSVFLLFVLVCMKLYKGGRVNPLYVIMLIIFINGTNELVVGIVNLLLLILLSIDYLKRRKINLRILLFNLISWICTAILVFSPGTSLRRNQFHYGGNLIGSMKVALIYGTKYIFLYLFEFPYILFYLLIFVLSYRSINKKFRLNSFPPLYLGIISFLCIISLFFINYYAIGLLSHHDRIANIVRLVMMTFFLLNIVNLAVYLRRRKFVPQISNRYIPPVIGLILLSILFFQNKNYVDLRLDFKDDNFNKFERALTVRENTLKSSSDTVVKLKRIEGTRILASGDKVMNFVWVQRCYREYINEKYDKDIQEINITK